MKSHWPLSVVVSIVFSHKHKRSLLMQPSKCSWILNSCQSYIDDQEGVERKGNKSQGKAAAIKWVVFQTSSESVSTADDDDDDDDDDDWWCCNEDETFIPSFFFYYILSLSIVGRQEAFLLMEHNNGLLPFPHIATVHCCFPLLDTDGYQILKSAMA